MGYDMYVCDREGNALKTNYEDDNYLRRSMGSQGPLRNALESAGMGYWPVKEPEFPAYPGDVHFDENYAPIDEVGRTYRQTVAELLVKVFDERPGISLHKLVMNEGWWVTQVECATALQLWERNERPMPEDFRNDLIPFLRQAAANGGFRVY